MARRVKAARQENEAALITISPDRDADGIVRLELTEDRDPQTFGTWRSFRLASTVRLLDNDFRALRAACEPGASEKPSAVFRRANATISTQFHALVAVVEPNILKGIASTLGTGGVPNFMVTADYGSKPTTYRCTIHTEVFLHAPTADDIAQLWQLIGSSQADKASDKLKTIGVVTEPAWLQALLAAALSA